MNRQRRSYDPETSRLAGVWRTGPWRRAAAGAGLLTDDGVPGTTIFAEMSALANATGAINLGQGFPDTDGPREVLLAAPQLSRRP